MNLKFFHHSTHSAVASGGAPHAAQDLVAGERRHRTEHLIQFCWALIIAKSLIVVWAVDRYNIPFSPYWIIVPTLAFATVATTAYYLLRE